MRSLSAIGIVVVGGKILPSATASPSVSIWKENIGELCGAAVAIVVGVRGCAC